MSAFGYAYLDDHLPELERNQLALLSFTSNRGRSGGEYAYEALNLVNGMRSVSEIRDWLTAELGPVPVNYVAEYLQALESIDVIQEGTLFRIYH